MTESREAIAGRSDAFLALLVHLAFDGLLVRFGLAQAVGPSVAGLALGALGALLFFALASGDLVLQPNEARALDFFGRYVGTMRTPRFSWSVPLTAKPRISLRVRNFSSDTIKMNDQSGSLREA